MVQHTMNKDVQKMKRYSLSLLLMCCVLLIACQMNVPEQLPDTSLTPDVTVAPEPTAVIITSNFRTLNVVYPDMVIIKGTVWPNYSLSEVMKDPKNKDAVFKVIVAQHIDAVPDTSDEPNAKALFEKKGIETAEIYEVYTASDFDPVDEMTDERLKNMKSPALFVAYITEEQLMSFRGELTLKVWLAP